MGKWKALLFFFIVGMLSLPAVVNAETLVNVTVEPEEDFAQVVIYSTEKQTEDTYYDLYKIKKEDDEWVNDAYIRQIRFPKADKERKGKYRYYSKMETVDWLKARTVYRLSPSYSKGSKSVPFWRKPII